MQDLLGLLVFVFGVQACLCCSPTVRHGGLPITAKESDLDFQVALVDAENPQEILCSGTLISRSLILTSKYCVEEKSEIIAFFGITSYPPDDVSEVVTRTFTPDDIQCSPLSVDDNIALLRFSDPIEIGDSVKPIALATRYMFSNLAESDAVSSFWTLQSPQRLIPALVEILSAHYRGERSFIRCGSSNAINLEDINDSGAPLYIIDKNGIPRLVGFNVQLNNDGVYDSLQSYTILESYLDWLLIEISIGEE